MSIANLVPAVTGMSRREIQADATEVIARHYPYLLSQPGPFPVLDFFEYKLTEPPYSLETGVEALGVGEEGAAYPDGRVFVSEETYRGVVNDDGRARFTMAHEAYHGIKHRNQIRDRLLHNGVLVLRRRQALPAYQDPEWQANVFASELLMPAQAVRLLATDNSSVLVADVMNTFQVSYKAAEIRLSQLGM